MAAVVFPLGAPGNHRGVLTIGRRHGREPFPQTQAAFVVGFAAQAGVALELAASGLRNLADRAAKLGGDCGWTRRNPVLRDREPGWNGASRHKPARRRGRTGSGP